MCSRDLKPSIAVLLFCKICCLCRLAGSDTDYDDDDVQNVQQHEKHNTIL